MRTTSATSISSTSKQHKSSLSMTTLLTIKETVGNGLEATSTESIKMYFETIYFASEIIFEEIEKKSLIDHANDLREIKSKSSLNLIRGYAELGMDRAESNKCQQYFKVIQKNTDILLDLSKQAP